MNRRKFLKLVMSLPSLALPFVPPILKRAFGQVTGNHEVTGLGFWPDKVIIAWNDINPDGYTTVMDDTIDGFLDVESFNEDSIALKTKDEIITIPYPNAGGHSEAALKDGSKIIYWSSQKDTDG